MGEVFLKRVNYIDLLNNPKIIVNCLEKSGIIKNFKESSPLALKIHFGEKGNTSYINPNFLLPLVQFLKKKAIAPFLFETNTLYRGKRMDAISHINLAYSHGFAKLNLPIIIGDGIYGNDYFEVNINKKHFSSCFIALALKDIKFILVLSHFTGHMLTGFGGSIKNLGMGCASKKGKFAQHSDVSPKILENKCRSCGVCAKNCPVNAIEEMNSKYFIIEEKCIGCAQCIGICPVGAVDIIWSEQYNLIMEKMVEYAYAVARNRECAYINFCLYITKECDCMNKEKQGFVKDIGLLFSSDPVSIDKASIDLIVAQEKEDIFKKIYPNINYLHQLQYAQNIGLGFLDYKLIEI